MKTDRLNRYNSTLTVIDGRQSTDDEDDYGQ